MSFIIRQKRGDKVYLYEATSVWDKDKKQSRQKRKYIGRAPDDKKPETNFISSDISTTNFGNIFLLDHISKKLGLEAILQEMFPNDFREILWLAYFDICAASPSYMFHYRQQEHDCSGARKLNSSAVSALHSALGKDDGSRIEFINNWIAATNPDSAVYYDVTSISSYAQGIETVEWGYNRDKESLPQINMGVVFSKKKSLPVYYNPYQGSVTDVGTLKHCLAFLNNANMGDVMFVPGRGFFSQTNISAMNDTRNGFKFIQPVPMSVKAAKEQLYKSRKELRDIENAFMYNGELWYYHRSELDYCNNKLFTHIYYSPKLATAQNEGFTIEILKIETKIKQQKLKGQKDFNAYKKNHLPNKYRDFFKWNRKRKCVEKNTTKINAFTTKFGCFILSTNQENLKAGDVLDSYRQKDSVEKMFDIVKNELDGDRLRTHNDTSTKGKLLVRFIALILYAEISRTMKQSGLFKKMTIKELLAELKKHKKTKIKNEKEVLSVLSKRQKLIYKAFDIDNFSKT